MEKNSFLRTALLGCLLLAAVSQQILGLGYSDFPADLQPILDEKIAVLNTQGGTCIAGQVVMSDAAPILSGADVQVNLYQGIDKPLWVYEGGWFIMDNTLPSSYAGSGKGFILRAFGYDPIDAAITILNGQMTYLEFVMTKTSPENLASVQGTVLDENNQPFNGAYVSLYFPFANHGSTGEEYSYPHQELLTEQDGQYEFTGLSVCGYQLVAGTSGYAYHGGTFTPPAGGTATANRKLYPNRRIIIDYVYQGDGSSSFNTGDLQYGTIDWLNGDEGMDFSEGMLKCCGWGRDLNMYQDQDVLKFKNFYSCGPNGFYDAGLVDFDSIAEAAATGYTNTAKLCLVGHVYVVKTYCEPEPHYAKFVVITNEGSFRTVVPGDSDPIDFAGYGLTLDFSACSNYGKIYVQKFAGVPARLERGVLPYYWEITGLEGLSFSADLIIRYDENDLASLGLAEESLWIMQSSNHGATWTVLSTNVDSVHNELYVPDMNSFSCWFAISAEHTLIADLDKNGIVDIADFAILSSQWLLQESWYPDY